MPNIRTNNIITLHHLKLIVAVVAVLFAGCMSAYAQANKSTKAERNYIKDGNKAFAEANYAKALSFYDLALAENAQSEIAMFNKALTLTRLSNPQDTTSMKDALDLYNRLGESASDASIKEKANYNLGNLAFYNKDYHSSIDFYKKVLRANPSNSKARENLRVAQLKLPPEDQNQQQQDQQQQQQQQQEQQQDQQQDQQQQQQQQQQQLTGNADQILQSMQNRENQTRKESEKKEVPVSNAASDKPW